MKRWLLLACLLAAIGTSAQSPLLNITPLTGNFYIYTTYSDYKGILYPANGMYVVTDSGVIMIDALWDASQTQPLLDSIEKRHQKKVKICVVTHCHDDRTAGLDVLKEQGVRTYSSVKSYENGKAEGNKTAAFRFTKDTTFTLGEISFETFYPGHGHTSDNIVVWFPRAKILYGGCFIKSLDANDLGNLEDADVASWELAVKRPLKNSGHPDL
jgi:metallo-beta-lactamase class B